MMTSGGIVVLVLMVALACAADAEAAAPPPRAGKLSVGWASADITPSQPVALCGQFTLRISKRVNDPLTVTALAIEARDAEGVLDQAVIVSCDLVGIRKANLDRVRELVTPRVPDLDPAKIILGTTHTHTGPAVTDAREDIPAQEIMSTFVYPLPEQGVMHPKEYSEFFAARTADAVANAWQARKPGGVSWGLSYAIVGHNRRAAYSTGRSLMYGATDKPEFDGFESTFDPGIELLFLWDDAKQLTGVAVNIACTSQEVESADYVSADYWHDARVELRKRHGNGLFILPLTGAAGDQSPHLLFRKAAEATMRKRKGNLTPRQEIGQRIAAAVDAGLELAKTDIRTEVPLTHKTQSIALPVRKVTKQEYETSKKKFAELTAKAAGMGAAPAPASTVGAGLVPAQSSGQPQGLPLPAQAKGQAQGLPLQCPDFIWWRIHRHLIARYETQDAEPTKPVEVHTLRLGDIAMATNPFELYVDYGLRMKARCPAEQTFVVQLARDCLAYLPTERGVAGGHYSAEAMSNVVGPEGGRVLVERTLESLKAMWGK